MSGCIWLYCRSQTGSMHYLHMYVYTDETWLHDSGMRVMSKLRFHVRTYLQ